jgi:hypothetical protein
VVDLFFCCLDQRSSKLAQFVIHRGLIISVMQAVFSCISLFQPIPLYQVLYIFCFIAYFIKIMKKCRDFSLLDILQSIPWLLCFR